MNTKEAGYVVEEIVDPFTPTWQSVTVPTESLDKAENWLDELVDSDNLHRYRIVLVYEIESGDR